MLNLNLKFDGYSEKYHDLSLKKQQHLEGFLESFEVGFYKQVGGGRVILLFFLFVCLFLFCFVLFCIVFMIFSKLTCLDFVP